MTVRRKGCGWRTGAGLDAEISNIGVATAFAAGVISFLSPCVLPLVPGYVSYVAGHPIDLNLEAESQQSTLSALGLSAMSVLGFSTVFVALGRAGTALHASAGAVMLLMSVAMISGKLSELSYWLLNAFPGLTRIGRG